MNPELIPNTTNHVQKRLRKGFGISSWRLGYLQALEDVALGRNFNHGPLASDIMFTAKRDEIAQTLVDSLEALQPRGSKHFQPVDFPLVMAMAGVPEDRIYAIGTDEIQTLKISDDPRPVEPGEVCPHGRPDWTQCVTCIMDREG